MQIARSFRRRVEKDQARSVCEQRILASYLQSHMGEAVTHRMWQPLDSNHHPQESVRDVGFPKRDIFSALVVPLWRCGATFYINLSSSTKMQRIADLKKRLGILCRSKKSRDHFGGRVEDFSAQGEVHVIRLEWKEAAHTSPPPQWFTNEEEKKREKQEKIPQKDICIGIAEGAG